MSRRTRSTLASKTGSSHLSRRKTSALPKVPRRPGNQAAQHAHRVQAKLAVSRPGDRHEQEADRVAEQVAAAPLAATPAIGAVGQGVQRKCDACEAEERRQAQGLVQCKAGPGSGSREPAALAEGLSGAGEPLPEAVRARFEPRFGRDFSEVRVHRDGAAGRLGSQMSARAFTLGSNIAFNRGEFRPGTPDGDRLLAHELTHVVQQSGGQCGDQGAQALSAAPTSLQANGGNLSDEDLRALQQYLQQLGAEPAATPAPGLSDAEAQAIRDFVNGWEGGSQGPSPGTGPAHGSPDPRWHQSDTHPAAGWYSGSPFSPPGSIDFGPLPRARGSCPGGACHSVNEAMRAQHEHNVAVQRRRDRLAQWPELRERQHGQALFQQAGSLEEDILRSEVRTTQLRMQVFDLAIAGGGSIDANVRSTWAGAQQATLFLETLLGTPDMELPEAVLPALRDAYAGFFTALTGALGEVDQREREMFEGFNRADPCPNCHRMSEPDRLGTSMDLSRSLFPELAPRPNPELEAITAWLNTGATPPPAPDPVGPRQERLNRAADLARQASAPPAWRELIGHFRWATGEMDAVLVRLAGGGSEARELVDQFDQTRQLLERQRRFQSQHAGAMKVQAVFYPKPREVEDFLRREGKEGHMEDFARGIPWQFYLTHTPLGEDPTGVPENFEWQLHDITAPNPAGRTVKVRYAPNVFERATRSMQTDPISEQDPPYALFAKLDHKDFFPEGHLYFNYPHSGRGAEVATHASRTFGEWLSLIGMGVALIGSLVFAPFSTPMLIAVGVGTGLSIAGNYMRLQEMREHGVATARDVNQFYWGLALDIMSALTLGLGRVATTAARAGNLARAATAGRYWFMLERAELAMNVANVGVVAYDFVQQYQAIERSNLSPEQKREALAQLTMFGLLAGGISLIPVATGVRDLRRGRVLTMVPDPENPSRMIGRFEPGNIAEVEQFRARPSGENAQLVGQGRGSGANQGHSYGVWSDGRITRCSDPPCPDIVEMIFLRIRLMRGRMLPDSPHASRVTELAEGASQLHLDSLAAVNATGGVRARAVGLQGTAKSLDDELAALERTITDESLASLRGHLSDPAQMDRLLAREWPEDIIVDFGGMLAAVARAGDFDAALLQRQIQVLRGMRPEHLRYLLDTTVQVNLHPNSRVFHMPDSLYWGRLSNSAEVTLLEAQLRGYHPSKGATRSLRGSPDALPGSTLDEFSTPQGEHHIDTLIGDPMPRQGFEDILPPRSQIEDPELRASLDIMVSERLHAVGAGFGAEAGTGVAHGSSFINQFLQNRGVEEMIRFLHRNRPPGVRYVVRVDVRTRQVGRGGETRMLDRITYRVRAVEETADGGFRPLREVFEATITHPRDIRAATRSRGMGDIQGIGIEVEQGFGALAEHFGL